MSKEIKNFFHSQFDEHDLIVMRSKEELEKNFINLVEICVKALKKNKKLIFLVMEEVQLILNIWPLN